MAKTTKTRYKVMRAGVLSVSLLSFLPLIGAMKLSQSDQSAGSTTTATTTASPATGTAQTSSGSSSSTTRASASQSTAQTKPVAQARTRAS